MDEQRNFRISPAIHFRLIKVKTLLYFAAARLTINQSKKMQRRLFEVFLNRRSGIHNLDFALFTPQNENFMRRDLKIYNCGLLLLFFVFASGSIYSQDLGSSNKLFDSSNPKTTTVKKTAPKSKNSSSKKPVKRNAPIRNAAKTTQTENRFSQNK